jgi:hypothetical protein
MGVIDPVHRPPRGGIRGHRAEQLVLIPQRRQVTQRVPAISDHHRQVGQHPARKVGRRERLVCIQQRIRPPGRQPGLHGQLAQQRHPGPRHQTGAVRADLDPPRSSVTLHLRGAFLFWELRTLDKPDFPRQDRHFLLLSLRVASLSVKDGGRPHQQTRLPEDAPSRSRPGSGYPPKTGKTPESSRAWQYARGTL